MCTAICITITKAILIKSDPIWLFALIVNCFEVIYHNNKQFLLSFLLFTDGIISIIRSCWFSVIIEILGG